MSRWILVDATNVPHWPGALSWCGEGSRGYPSREEALDDARRVTVDYNARYGAGGPDLRAREMYHIAYVTGLDGWGGTPTQDDRESYCALVEARLHEKFPRHTVEAYVDEDALEARVQTDDNEIDTEHLCRWIGNDVLSDWCAGERAPEET